METNKVFSFTGTKSFEENGAFSQAQKIEIGIAAILGLTAAFFFDYSYSNFGKKAFPCRYFHIVPEQFFKLFFKTIGVIKDCLQSFNPDRQFANQDKSIMYDSGRISEKLFGVDHNLFLMILIFAIAGPKDPDWIQSSGDKTGYAFSEWIPSGEDNKTEDNDAKSNRLCVHSGRISLSRYPINREMIPVGSQPPLKQTGLYEKGDCYQ